LELLSARPFLIADDWKSALLAALAAIWPGFAPSRITLTPMSDTWMHEHAADFSKHQGASA
jgi:hypothetical protein